MSAPDPSKDSTGAAVTLTDKVVSMADDYASKAARSLPTISSNFGRNSVVDAAIIKANMYEFMLKVLAMVEADLE